MENLIVVKQLPIIEEQLAAVKNTIQKKIDDLSSVVCTEDTVKDIKAIRAELNKEFGEWEERRKEVKKAVSEPYEKFEKIYKECVSDIYKKADADLKEKIDDVQEVIRGRKKEEILKYFEEHKKVDERYSFVAFDMTGIAVNLSSTLGSLKQKVSDFFDKVHADLECIQAQEYSDEILYEYQQTLSLPKSLNIVQNRHKALEQAEQKKQTEETEIKQDMPLQKPVEIDEKIYTVAFKVKATKEKIIELKKFLINGGYDYE